MQIHLGLSGTNTYWVMWATGQGKVCYISLSVQNPELLYYMHAKHHLPI